MTFSLVINIWGNRLKFSKANAEKEIGMILGNLMKLLNSIIAFALAGMTGCSSTPPCRPSSAIIQPATSNQSFSIVNGTDVTDPNHWTAKSTVLLITSSSGKCSGTLISTTHVLTAAHCLQHGAPKAVIFGLNESGIAVSVKSARGHPGYHIDSSGASVNDIGVVTLNSQAPSGTIPIKLADTSMSSASVTQLVAAGFGITSQNEQTSAGRLRFTSLPTATFVPQRYPDQLAIVGNGSGTCQGDSGGPLFAIINGSPIGELVQLFSAHPVHLLVHSPLLRKGIILCPR